MESLKSHSLNFLDLPPKYSNPKTAKFVIIPFPLEKTPSYGEGTAKGPEAIIKASLQVELWDEELENDPSKIGITTLPIPKMKRDHKKALDQLTELVAQVYQSKKFPIIIGGEHSLTVGSLRGLLQSPLYKGKKITLFHFDAHADLRTSWEGSRLSHASALRRALEVSPHFNLVQIGVRNISEEELPFWRANQKKIRTFFAKDKKRWPKTEILKHCQDDVFLTFDFDVLDPSIMPSTGTPEPGGLDWYETLDLLRLITSERRVIGADFTEFSPIKGFHAPDFLAAKFIYKFIGYLVAYKNIKTIKV